MADGFSQWRGEMDAWRLRVRAAAAEGVSAAMPLLQSEARSTTIYGDDTGATRGSTVAYAIAGDGSVDESDRADAAYEFAEDRRPGSASDDYVVIGDDEVVGVLTTFTYYSPDLENRGGGANGFIGPTMDSLGPQIVASVERAIARVL